MAELNREPVDMPDEVEEYADGEEVEAIVDDYDDHRFDLSQTVYLETGSDNGDKGVFLEYQRDQRFLEVDESHQDGFITSLADYLEDRGFEVDQDYSEEQL